MQGKTTVTITCKTRRDFDESMAVLKRNPEYVIVSSGKKWSRMGYFIKAIYKEPTHA